MPPTTCELLLRRYRQPAGRRRHVLVVRERPRRRRAGAVRGARGRPRGAAMTTACARCPSTARSAASRTSGPTTPPRGMALRVVRARLRVDRDHGRGWRLMADPDPRAPWHEPAMPVLDEEAAWVHEAAQRFEHAHRRGAARSGRSRASTRSSRSARPGGVDGMVLIDMAWRLEPRRAGVHARHGAPPTRDVHALRGGPRALRHRRRVRVPRHVGGGLAREPRRPEPHVSGRRPAARVLQPCARSSRSGASSPPSTRGSPACAGSSGPRAATSPRSSSTATTAAS